MKLKNYIESIENNQENDYDDEFDPNAEVDHLCSLLRKLYKNAGVNNVYIQAENFDIIIYITMNKVEKMKNVMRALDITKKINDDILIQYNSEFELWETKDHQPLMNITFIYNKDIEISQENSPL